MNSWLDQFHRNRADNIFGCFGCASALLIGIVSLIVTGIYIGMNL
jgi:hypothetical protein